MRHHQPAPAAPPSVTTTPPAIATASRVSYTDLMTRQMTITEVKAKLLALIDEVESGDEIEITRHGITVARLAPARGPHALKGKFAGVAMSAVVDEELFSTGWDWT